MLLVDYRRGSKELAFIEPLRSILAQCPNCTERTYSTCESCYKTGRTLCKLSSGDIAFTGNGPDNLPIMVGVEVKEVTELLSSISTGRIQDTQIGSILDTSGLIREYDERWILYYGRYRSRSKDEKSTLQIYKKASRTRREGWYYYTFNENIKDPYAYLEGFLCSPSLTRLQINVKHTETVEEAASWLTILYGIWQKDWSKHKSMRNFDKSTYTPIVPGMTEDQYRGAMVAKELPGVGFERALKIVNYFNSLDDMFNGKLHEWQDVIGKVLGRNVFETIKKKWSK